MAENIDDVQRQLADAMRRAQEDYARYGQLQTATSEELKDAQMKAKYGVENFSKATNKAGEVLGALAGAGIESTKAMYQGKKGMGAFNSSLDELSKAATLAGTALTLLMPGGIIMKAIVGAFTLAAGAAIAYVKAANEMSDKLYKGYEGLQKSGAAASDGMTGVYRDAKKLGLSMDELDSMVSLVAESSNDLVLFGGTVADGRRKLADLAQASETSREGFFKLGISQQAQNEAMVGYMRLQARSGNAEKQTTDQLAASARNYITEQDQLARITGMNVKDQQKAREAALMEEQFLAKVRQLQREGKHAEAKELQDANVIMSAMGDEVGKGFRAMVNGNLRDENARKFMMSTQGAGLDAVQKITTGQIKAAGAAQLVSKGFQGYLDAQGDQLATLGVAGESATNYAQVVKGAAMGQEDYQKQLEKAQADQAKTLAGKGDPLADAQGRMIKVQQDINKKLEDDVFKGIPNAQVAMGKLANVTDSLADAFTKLTNAIGGVLNFFGLGPEVTVEQKQTEVTGAEQKLSAAIDAQKTAKTPAEKQQADQDRLYYEEKVKNLKLEKMNLIIAEDNALYEKEVLKRAEIDAANKKAAYAKTMESATAGQKIGIGRTEKQKEAFKENQEAESKLELLKRSSESGVNARAASVEQLKSTGYKPPASERRQSSSAASSTTQTPGQGLEIKSQQDLEKMGLKIKQGDVQAKDAGISTKLIDMAKEIQNQVPGFSHFSGFNDKFHQEKSPSSNHTKGLAADFALASDPTPQAGKEIADMLRKMGASYVQDEYNNKSAKATGGHFHVEVPTFADGGELAAGKLGIAGEAGPEFVQGPASITPMGDITGVFNNMAMMIGQQTGAIEELIRIAKNGNDIQTKILRQQT
jgi:hypothetical protein